MIDGVGYMLRLCQSLTLGQEYFHSKLVAVGIREKTDLQRRSNERREQNECYANTHRQPRMAESLAENSIVGLLHPFGNRISIGTHLAGLDDFHFQERYQQYSQ